jgi:DNA-directed RNA polymerase specialized sigma24 family protein
MTTLKEFEEALRADGNEAALAVLQTLKDRDKAKRRTAPARRVTGKKMTSELARRILELHGATRMTQQEIAFKLGVNQGRVNEVIKRGKWLTEDPLAPEAILRDRALARMAKAKTAQKPETPRMRRPPPRSEPAQLSLGDF